MIEGMPKCDKCGGKVIRDGTEYKCLQCGQEWKTVKEKRAWYELNRKDILADFKALGRGNACKKWQIPLGSFARLLQRWSPLKPEDPVPAPAPAINVMLPGLPVFSDTWPESVQIKWLETYLAILLHGETEAKKHG